MKIEIIFELFLIYYKKILMHVKYNCDIVYVYYVNICCSWKHGFCVFLEKS